MTKKFDTNRDPTSTTHPPPQKIKIFRVCIEILKKRKSYGPLAEKLRFVAPRGEISGVKSETQFNYKIINGARSRKASILSSQGDNNGSCSNRSAIINTVASFVPERILQKQKKTQNAQDIQK